MSKDATLTLTNDIHNTSTTIPATFERGDDYQVARVSGYALEMAHRDLCGIEDCECGGGGHSGTTPDGEVWTVFSW